jgi:hypothetical protein
MFGVSTEVFNFLSTIAAVILSVGSGVSVISWWLSGQFAKTRNLIDEKIARLEGNLIHKFEYHERHDDQRFTEVKNDIWELRLENAAREHQRSNREFRRDNARPKHVPND